MDIQLSDEQKAKIEPHVKAALKSMYLAGFELGKAVAEITPNKIDDAVVNVGEVPLEAAVDGIIAGIKI